MPPPKKVTYKGKEYRSISALARDMGKTHSAIIYKINHKLPMRKLKPGGKKKQYEYRNKFYTIDELCDKYDLSKGGVFNRLRNNIPLELEKRSMKVRVKGQTLKESGMTESEFYRARSEAKESSRIKTITGNRLLYDLGL